MDTITLFTPLITDWQVVLAGGAALVAAWGATAVIIALTNRWYLQHQSMVWLELTPPSSIDKTPEATEQLFSVIHGLRAARHWTDKLRGRETVISCEIVSTRRQGIRYLIQVEQAQAKSLQKIVAAYLPDATIKQVVRPEQSIATVREFTEANHYILPLTLTSPIERHDPLSYVVGAMTTLSDDEELTMQLIVSPVRLRSARRLARQILSNEDILEQAARNRLPLVGRTSSLLHRLATSLADLTGELMMGTIYGHANYAKKNGRRQAELLVGAGRDKPARTLSMFESELMETMHQKVTQPLFRVNLRVLIRSQDTESHLAALTSALDGFSVPPYQSLHIKRPLPVFNRLRQRLATKRLPSLLQRSAMILSTSELASLYHFPSHRISQTDNLIASLSKTLPAPVSLKSGRKLAVLIGENHHHGTVTPIGLTEAERERHLYIIGGTGNGKTTMLFYSIVQDIQAGHGLAVLDPHGDLAERLLRYIPEERIQDVIYMNPDDLSHPIGMNLLELPEGLTGDDLLREKDLITEATISVLRKVFSDDDSGGHRVEYILRNTIQTALTLEGATLFTIFRLLNDAKYRRQVAKGLEDKDMKDFWINEMGKAGDFQRVKMSAGITAKIGRFLFSASARRILEQPKSTINFEDIIGSQKILICNFSKGLLGEDTSSLFGTTVLAKLQTAALRRARIAEQNRVPFYLYVDEFQNFATMSFVQMLSEARKYKLYLTMAEQSTSQQDEQRLVDIILANVGTVVCFRSGSPADERLLLPLFYPHIEQGEIANLPSYSFYARIAAVHSQEPMSGVTIVFDDIGNGEVAKRVIASSRVLYVKKEEKSSVQRPPIKKGAPSTAKRPKSKLRYVSESKDGVLLE